MDTYRVVQADRYCSVFGCLMTRKSDYGEKCRKKKKLNDNKGKKLRPAGSDPEVVCQKNSSLKVSVSLGGFGPSVAHEKHSVRRRCVQATKNKAETCSLLDAIGRRSCGRWREWVKNRRLGKPRGVRFDSRLVWSVRCDTLWAWNGCSVFLLALLNVSGNIHTVSLLHAS